MVQHATYRPCPAQVQLLTSPHSSSLSPCKDISGYLASLCFHLLFLHPNGVQKADRRTGRFPSFFQPVNTAVAFLYFVVLININDMVRAGTFTGFTADTPLFVCQDQPVLSISKKCSCGTDLRTDAAVGTSRTDLISTSLLLVCHLLNSPVTPGMNLIRTMVRIQTRRMTGIASYTIFWDQISVDMPCSATSPAFSICTKITFIPRKSCIRIQIIPVNQIVRLTLLISMIEIDRRPVFHFSNRPPSLPFLLPAT